MHAFLAVCEEAARAGGEVLQHWRGRFAVRSKAPADLVTEADFQSQRRIREIVLKAFPDHDFLGEEADGIPTETAKYRWIVDPLDGTTNYVHGLPHYSVSIGLMQDDEPIVGVVFDPAKDECFAAAKGFGATLNGESIRASQVVGLEEALVVTGFAPGVTGDSEEAAMFLHMLGHCQAIRRLGSSALNLAYVACGRLDAYWGTTVKSWDVAAGILLVREAGGVVSDIDGTPFKLEFPRTVASATPQIHQQVLSVLQRATRM